ncbi:MAG: alpha-ribazole phosphatase [Muribaculaceae bacterium]|nr:alpha-ribazole phosphatase [Muribaculaceae bacterium]
MQLILIRHTSVAVPRGVCYGQTDVALAESFPDEASAVKENLKKFTFDKVYSSPLSRCVKLAHFCGYENPIIDHRLIEMNFGEWEMKPYDEITDPRLQEWFDDYINVAATGGESVLDQRRRLMDFIDEIKELHSDNTIGIFTHGGILINALVALAGKSYSEMYNALPPYGSIIEIGI